MDIEAKKEAMESLRLKFIELITHIINVPGSVAQKQQALIRFDEGHMWMQNAIASYIEPTPAPPIAEAQVNVNLEPNEAA